MTNLEPPIRASNGELQSRQQILSLLENNPVDSKEVLLNLGLFIEPRLLSRLLFLNFLYEKILPTQGIIMDLGTRWGQNAVVCSTLRAIYEPYNYQRKIVAFDTFDGFAGAGELDGMIQEINGQGAMPTDYDTILKNLLNAHEHLHPINHIVKNQVVKGDVSITVPEYIKQNPETIVALAYFDLDLYKPTYNTIKNIENRLTVGSILAFDELNYDSAPGETLAVIDALGLRNIAVKRFPYCSRVSYIEIK